MSKLLRLQVLLQVRQPSNPTRNIVGQRVPGLPGTLFVLKLVGLAQRYVSFTFTGFSLSGKCFDLGSKM